MAAHHRNVYLFTSQRPLPGSHQELEPLLRAHGAQRRTRHDAEVARTVAAKLDRLPLGLEQAGAYLEQTEGWGGGTRGKLYARHEPTPEPYPGA